MKYIILTFLILLTLAFSGWCGSQAKAAEPAWWRTYCITNWLQEVTVEISMPVLSDPNGPAPDMADPNNWVMETKQVRINLVTLYVVDRNLMREFTERLHPANREQKLQPLIIFHGGKNE